MKVFLSHNHADKPLARRIGGSLVLLGVDVWFDEWEISAGDSIPGALDKGLESFDWFVILWSQHSARSNWVRQELHSAITKAMSEDRARIVVCKVDGTALPPLIADRRYIEFSDEASGLRELLEEATGKRGKKARLAAIQAAIERLDVRFSDYEKLGTYVCCPECGEEGSLKEGYFDSGDTVAASFSDDPTSWPKYRTLTCRNCGWSKMAIVK